VAELLVQAFGEIHLQFHTSEEAVLAVMSVLPYSPHSFNKAFKNTMYLLKAK